MKKKKFPSYTEHGLGVSKSGKLMIPYKATREQEDNGLNVYGQPYVEIGDYACMPSHNGLITKSNIGRVVDQDYIEAFGPTTNIQRLNGTVGEAEMWTYGVYRMTEGEYIDALVHYSKSAKI